MQYENDRKSGAVFVGTDGRMKAAAAAAAKDGFLCRLITEKVPAAELAGRFLVLPVAAAQNGIYDENELIAISAGFASVFGGMFSQNLAQRIRASGAHVFDYMADETYVLKNAQITSQLAVGLLMAHTDRAFSDMVFAITGDGRIGTLLHRYLTALGGRSYLFSRKEAPDAHPYRELPQILSGTDRLINTVPSPIIGVEELRYLPASSTALELASKPGGFTEEAVKLLGNRLLRAPGLPGKYAPESAGLALWQAILRAHEAEERRTNERE